MSSFESLNPLIQDHVKQIAKTSGMPVNPETWELMATAWIEKKNCFEANLEDNDLEELQFFAKDEPRGAIVLTYSGSIINIGPLVDGVRRCEYSSIGIRTDVPVSAVNEASEIANDIEVDSIAEFRKGPIKASSPLYKIAVAKEKMEPEDEAALLTQVSQAVVEDFVEVNKTLVL